MTPALPPGHIVRFDYHRHPRSTTAVVVNQRTRNVVAVGVAKFNPRDGEPNQRAGENIALHRALQTIVRPGPMRDTLPKFIVPTGRLGLRGPGGLDDARYSLKALAKQFAVPESTLELHRRLNGR